MSRRLAAAFVLAGCRERASRPWRSPSRRLATRRRASPSAVTYRNRELANLLLVGLLTATGFASVYIARQDVVSTASLSYAARE